jgi:hypothetical protein
MLIYRIEDEDAGGPYRGNNSDKNPFGSATASDRHPLPADDSLLQDSIRFRMERDLDDVDDCHWSSFLECEFIFGFASVEQMRNWVYNDTWLTRMDDNGFFLSVFDVPEDHICIGNTQAVFRRNHAISIRRYTMAEFFNL